jgi:hypothetical protein
MHRQGFKSNLPDLFVYYTPSFPDKPPLKMGPPRPRIPEPKPLDHHILEHGGTTSTLDNLPHRVQHMKSLPLDLQSRNEELVRENQYLRQEISRLTQVNDALLALRETFMEVFYCSRTALQTLSNKMATADGELADYWGLRLDETQEDDITVI